MVKRYYKVSLNEPLWIGLQEMADREGLTRQELIEMVLNRYVNYRLEKETSPAMVDGLSVLIQRELENTKLLQRTLRMQAMTLDYIRVTLGAEDLSDGLEDGKQN